MSDHPAAEQEPTVPLDLPPEVPEADAIEQRISRPGDPGDAAATDIVHDAEDRPVELDDSERDDSDR
jgi:hypothetical protein